MKKNKTNLFVTFLAAVAIYHFGVINDAHATEKDNGVNNVQENVVEVQEITETPVMDLPAVTHSSDTTTDKEEMAFTHPVMRMMPDKSQMVRLDQKAASVIVGNPNHISVMLDTPDTLVVVPRAPGASHFSVMGEDGSLIMQRHVVVGAATEQYIRIRRSCDPSDQGCETTSVYFCPDMCHEVRENTQRQR